MTGDPLASLANARILVVDDTAANRALVRALLGAFGLTPEEARNGEEAIALAQGAAFDLILMDVHMPRLDGLAATRAIRAGDGRCRSVPIIALSADVTPQNTASFIAAGMDDAIAKPISAGELIGKITAWLDRAAPSEVPAKAGPHE